MKFGKIVHRFFLHSAKRVAGAMGGGRGSARVNVARRIPVTCMSPDRERGDCRYTGGLKASPSVETKMVSFAGRVCAK